MPNQFFSVAISITLVTLSLVLIWVFILMIRSVKALAEALRELRRDLTPALSGITITSQNLALASEGLRQGVQNVTQLTDAVGAVGADLAAGHRGVKTGFRFFGRLLGPWLGKLLD